MKNQVSSQQPEINSEFTVFNDLTERLIDSYNELEEQVSALQHRLESVNTDPNVQALLESIPAALIILDQTGKVARVNREAEMLLQARLPGRQWREVMTEVFHPRQDDGHEISLANGRRVSICTSPMADAQGQVILINDVTEARELQEKVNHYQRLSAMGEMAASLAHQIRTPLSTALLYASLLKKDTLAAERRDEVTDKLSDRLQHMESLIKDMLLFVRGGVAGDEEIDSAELIEELEAAFRGRFQDKQLILDIKQDCRCLIKGNHAALSSAVGNLLENCLEHCHPGNRVSVEARSVNADFLELGVSDDGPGIPEDAQNRIFEPFFTTHAGGTGLGLAVAESVARAHNGYLWFRSEPGQGSFFSFRVPVFRYIDRVHLFNRNEE